MSSHDIGTRRPRLESTGRGLHPDHVRLGLAASVFLLAAAGTPRPADVSPVTLPARHASRLAAARPIGARPATATPPIRQIRHSARRAASAAVERKVLSLVVQSPAGKLPPALIDRRTGLPAESLEARCRSVLSRAYLCVVRPARRKPGEGLHVRCRPTADGRGSFTWYPYRGG